ncbi:S-layer homology domain-containing protein [Aquibacillus rhizosphaerae]|uniref:S-layer homology domain-containing protein n=1 Tax=Aquibacillus rhizosphaerae TaxID=3051431 RepID=A0ABT7KZI9_9BACI|nr:S-layer homology domain-containing protein [Aquibacillus sp. LR5S19]MDL4838891.1 S-layer homology domain-containing protein [Aquibacillus sp. LR5S19]
MGINKNSIMLLIALVFVFCNSTISYAETNNRKIDIKYNESVTIDLKSGLELQVANADNSSYKILNEGEVLYVEQVSQGIIEKVHIENNYLLVESRLLGSGSYVSFDLFYLEDANLIDIYHSTDFTRGIVTYENNEISVTYPKYVENDESAESSSLEVQTFKLSDQQIVLGDKTIEKVETKSMMKSNDFNNYKNPSASEINKMITEAANAKGIPPEILKAIAWQESTWRQFDTNGSPITNLEGDGGFGIMQITLPKSYLSDHPEVEHQLKYDIKYNIQKGAEILLEKWNLAANPLAETALPIINNGSKDKLENWYFAIMAYNGRSKVNDPNLGPETYQETIYRHIQNQGLLSVTPIDKNVLDLYYKPNSTTIYFGNKLNYNIPGPLTGTKQSFKKGQVLPTTSVVNLREHPEGELIRGLEKGEPVLVTGEKVYPSSEYNHYVLYPVKTRDGETGYVASSYLGSKNSFLDFSSPDNRGFEEVSALAEQEIIGGFSDGTFRPTETLTRVQAALMFVRALNLPTPDVPETGFSDVKVGDNFYREIAAAKEAGIFRGAGGKFNKSDKLTRSEMAAVLVRSFEIKGSSDKRFKDVPAGHQFESAIQTLYANNITSGINDTEYGFRKEITRRDFSILLYRALAKYN